MKRILSLWLAAALFAAQSCYAVVMVGFGQISGPETEILSPNWAATFPSATNTSWSTWDANDADSNHVVCLSDTSDSTYVYRTPGAANYIIPLADTTLSCSGGSVTLYLRAKSTAANDQLTPLIFDGAYMTEASPKTLTTNYVDYSITWTAAADAGSWTQAKINTLGGGMSNNGTQTGTIYVAKMWLVRTCP